MKIGIFQEPAGGMGGSEMVMADAMRDRHEVEIVHHRPDLSIDREQPFGGKTWRHPIWVDFNQDPHGLPAYYFLRAPALP
jgi:hypothetical protein